MEIFRSLWCIFSRLLCFCCCNIIASSFSCCSAPIPFFFFFFWCLKLQAFQQTKGKKKKKGNAMLYLHSECLHKNAVKVHTNIHTQRCHEYSGGLFPVILPFVNQPAWDMMGWLPWKMGSQSLRGMFCEQMKISGKLLSFETFDVTLSEANISTFPLPVFRPACVCIYQSVGRIPWIPFLT